MTKTAPASRGTQMDLFRQAPGIPAWSALPTDVQQKVRALLARLLREHRAARSDARRRQKEVCGE